MVLEQQGSPQQQVYNENHNLQNHGNQNQVLQNQRLQNQVLQNQNQVRNQPRNRIHSSNVSLITVYFK